MKIIVSQQNKKIEVIFKRKNTVDKYSLDKADDFLNALDKFTKKRKIDLTSLRGAKLEIKQARPVRKKPLQAAIAAPLAKRISNGPSLLTERIIRAILQGISIDLRK